MDMPLRLPRIFQTRQYSRKPPALLHGRKVNHIEEQPLRLCPKTTSGIWRSAKIWKRKWQIYFCLKIPNIWDSYVREVARMFIVLALIEINFLGRGAAYVNNTKRSNTSWSPSYQQPRQTGYSDLVESYYKSRC